MYQNLQTAPKAVLGGENSNKCLPQEIRKDKWPNVTLERTRKKQSLKLVGGINNKSKHK